MTAAVAAGAIAQAAAWLVIRRRGGSVWTTTAPVLGIAGLAAVLVARPALSGRIGVPLAVGAGVVVGAAFYVATLAFVRIVAPVWRTFDAHARGIYASRSVLPPFVAIAVAAGVAAVGEELFWRGLVFEWATDRFGAGAGAGVATWLGYVLINVPSRNLAIVAGAAVGGALWTALAAWSEGVLASVVCHALWTSLMLARPVIGAPAER